MAKRSELELPTLNVESEKCQVPKGPFPADVCNGIIAVPSFVVAPHFHLSWEPACTSIVHLVNQMGRVGNRVLIVALRNKS